MRTQSSIKLSIITLLCFTAGAAQLSQAGGCKETEPKNSAGRIAAMSEPGEPMKVRGRVFRANGELAVGVTVYAYHTDRAGEYDRDKNGEARLCGIVRTDSLGQYQFETIRPASYPGTNIPAHIHFIVWDDSTKEQQLTLEFGKEYEFNADYRARFGPGSDHKERTATVRPLALDSEGIWHCARDLQLK